MKRWLALLVALLLSVALAAAGGASLSAAQEARAQQLGSTLRCPVCRGVPITQSPNDLSEQMLRTVREQVAAGRTNEQIYAYFASRFGPDVLLSPPKRGLNLALWLLPALALLAGGWVLARYLRRVSRSAPPAADPELLARVQRDLSEGERQVRR